jgi:arsenical pump membrane protein
MLGILVRPWRSNEAWWSAGGAFALVAIGAVSPANALHAIAGGTDVLLFLAGMTALAAFARGEGVFERAAALAVTAARGSRMRLFAIVYGVGVVTTALLSNDAAIVVLTPAVIVAVGRAGLPPAAYVMACALVANAASTLLPIANPANLLFYPGHVPRLDAWFVSFALASVAAIVLTYLVLAVIYRGELRGRIAAQEAPSVRLPSPRRTALIALAFSAIALIVVASIGGPIGVTAALLGSASIGVAATRNRAAARHIVRGVGWTVIVMTGGLFVILGAFDAAGAAELPRALFAWAHALPPLLAAPVVAIAAAFASNVVTNLPVGLEFGRHLAAIDPPAAQHAAALVGVDIGPNLTINGSLATFLWLAILRQNNIPMSAGRFALVGALATPPALIAAALLVR